MRTIEIEGDVYDYLLKNTTQIGETASQILRRLLDLNEANVASDEILDTEFLEYLNTPAFKEQRTGVGRFLYMLSYLHKKDPERFKNVLKLSGRERKYFALNHKDLDDSGISVNPQQIPDSPYWVITNTDTRKKRRMIHDVMTLLGYSENAVKQALGELTY